jgi:CRISPR-associated protein Csb2
MAMAAGHFETGGDPEERKALEWIESQGPPALYASGKEERTEVRAYVPVNDDHGGIVRRPRQDRSFLRVRPDHDCVFLIWPSSEPTEELRAALQRVCAKVTRIGHSSSFAQMWVVPAGQEPAANLVPSDSSASERLRVAESGTLQCLEEDFRLAEIAEYSNLSEALTAAKGKELKRLKAEIASTFPGGPPQPTHPQLSSWQGYQRVGSNMVDESVFEGPFDPNFIVLSKLEGLNLGLESTLQLTSALRRQAMDRCPAPKSAPEWLSGHDESGKPSARPHVAFFPLPFVGSNHADGHVMGLGIAIPGKFPVKDGSTRAAELQTFLGPLFFEQTGEERIIRIEREKVWQWDLVREERERPPEALRAKTWIMPSRLWASVTPVVLHHYPKRREGDVERILREAFVSAHFPEPTKISVRPVSRFEGAGHARAIPFFTEGGESLCRYQTHITVEFDRQVRGPMLIGRGRFRGYGLLRPLNQPENVK